MLAQGGVGARVNLSAVPVLEGTRVLAAEGLVPAGTRRNKESLDADVAYDARTREEDRLVLCDAQTSGGLLFAVEPARTPDLLSNLRAADVAAAEVGEFVEGQAGKIEVLP
jgi:selenide,water dikinase